MKLVPKNVSRAVAFLHSISTSLSLLPHRNYNSESNSYDDSINIIPYLTPFDENYSIINIYVAINVENGFEDIARIALAKIKEEDIKYVNVSQQTIHYIHRFHLY